MIKTYPQGICPRKYSDLDVLIIDNLHCEAVIALQGAQVLSFKQKKTGKDILWLSKGNQYQKNQAIRGGIPLCFPWFGQAQTSGPSHGFARNKLWQCIEVLTNEEGHILKFKLTYDDQTLLLWPFKFELIMTIHCGKSLRLSFELINLDIRTFNFTFAWHSYFHTDISSAQIQGLEGLEYIDQLKAEVKKQLNTQLKINQETDQIYPVTSGNFVIRSDKNSEIHIKSNTDSAVIWNPWIEKSKKLKDIIGDDWTQFVCLENGQIATAGKQLKPNQKIQYELYIN